MTGKTVSMIFCMAACILAGVREGHAQRLQDGAENVIPTVKWAGNKAADGTLPASVDNSLSGYFPPVISQQGGSCAQASYIGYMFTYEINSLLDRDSSLPGNRFSYFYTWNFINGGKDEGSTGTDGLNIALANGVISEEDFPRQYTGTQFYWASGYDKYLRGIHYRVKNFLTIDLSTEEGISKAKTYLYNKGKDGATGGLLTFSSYSSNWSIDNRYDGPSETGYRCLLTRLATEGAHAMTIVGYDDLVESDAPDGTKSKGAFIVANTWGEDYFYHDRGRYYLPYRFFMDEDSHQYLRTEVIGTDVEYRKPKIVFRVGVDYTSRDDLSFRFGVGNRDSATPVHNYNVPIAQNQGGDYPMQGRYQDTFIEFGFDFSSYAQRADSMEEPTYFLTVVKTGRGEETGEGRMTGFAVYDYRDDYDNPKIYTHKSIDGTVLHSGENIFRLPTAEPARCSYSPVVWLGVSGQPAAAPLIFRTASGKYAKVRLSDYDRENGTIRIKYVYAPDGSRNIE